MNLILFEPEELEPDMTITLKAGDIRAVHLKKILKAETGTSFEAGILNGMQGKASITDISEKIISLRFSAEAEPVGLHPLTLLLGLSRPPTVKKVLKEATALGIERFVLCGTENGERSYIQSSALKDEKIREVLIEGVQQAVCTQLPEVRVEHSLRCAIESLQPEADKAVLIALDNYQATISLSEFWKIENNKASRVTLAIGSERGWTDKERQRLRDAGFTLCSLGARVLRTETASIAGASVCLSGMGLI
ncbi:MAG TPA: 16S rRNA methyltransferase [Spirochaeta sp.]|nr:16S rRNA methyltransferase [Spirochaeta sp.]